MELVYLWVEEYKNIHKQGFDFSPRFECEFDNEILTINEKKENEYIKDFFAKDINVMAIVGKNGTGKSSLLKLIMRLIYINQSTNEESEKSFLIIHTSKGFHKISKQDNIKESKYNENYIEINSINSESIDFFTVHFNYMLDTLYDNKKDVWIKKIYHKTDAYKTPLLLEPYKNHDGKQQINLDNIEYLNNQNMLKFYSKFDDNRQIFEFFKPNKIMFKIATRESIDILKTVLPKEKKKNNNMKGYRLIFYKFIELYNKKQFPKMGRNKEKLRSIYMYIQKLYKDEKYKYIAYLYIALKVLSSRQKLFNKEDYEVIKNWANQLEGRKELLLFCENLDLNTLIAKDTSVYEVRKIQININFIQNKIYEHINFTENINKVTNISDIKDILIFLPSWLDIEWFENNKSIKSLSSGEKSFFTIIINLMNHIQNINDDDKYQTINIFLDEIEQGFHPQWQKEYLDKLLFSLNKINKKRINLIFASHSPFLLSDIPKQNIIFLDTYDKKKSEKKYPNLTFDDLKDGNCINVTKELDIKPFGANIHNLLAHGFFMEDGLMGEFALKKIQNIVDFYTKVKDGLETEKEYKDVKKEFYFIRDNIGEEYIKGVITNHIEFIEEKLEDESFKEKRIKQLKKELKELGAKYDRD